MKRLFRWSLIVTQGALSHRLANRLRNVTAHKPPNVPAPKAVPQTTKKGECQPFSLSQFQAKAVAVNPSHAPIRKKSRFSMLHCSAGAFWRIRLPIPEKNKQNMTKPANGRSTN